MESSRIWNLDNGIEEPLSLVGHQGQVQSVAFSRDGARLVSGGIDGTVRLWDVTSGSQLVTLQQHEGQATSVDFSVDGLHVLSADEDDHTLRIYSCEVCGSLKEVLSLSRSRGADN